MSAAEVPATRMRVEERPGGILAIVLDRAGSRVNLIDEKWIEEMEAALERAEAENPRGLVLLSAKRGNFIAGADVALIAALRSAQEAEAKSRRGQELLARIEELPFPTVAAINGACLGGGLETALALRWRVAVDDPALVLGFPEVRLGILPGFGGTWRLPRAVGINAALPLILTGRNLRPRQALALGLVDRLAAPEILERVGLEIARGHPPARRRRGRSRSAADLLLGRTAPGRALLRAMTRRNVQRKTGGHYPAPREIADRVIESYGAPRGRAMAAEARSFGRLALTPVAKNLLFIFQGSEALARYPWRGASAPVDTDSRRAAVIGAGTMGGGIAGALARAGIQVRMKDVNWEALRIGLAGAAAPLERRVRRRAMRPRERDAILARISPTTTPTGLARSDFAIEAVPELLELKQAVFRELEERLPETAYLATNTSSLPIARIAAALERPERLVGLHFFNPVDRMPLVEVIPGERTGEEILRRAVGIVRRLKKTPLVVADRPGFLVNRLLLPYLNEAAFAVDEGWPPQEIDAALRRFGMPMGPLRVLDEVGIDVAAKVSAVMEKAFGERMRPAPVMQRLLESGALGAKAGRGFFRGSGKKREANWEDLRVPTSRGMAPRAEEIVERLLLGAVNEAARCLAEGVVSAPDHLDLGTVLGTGFPPFRGGLRRWARTLGEATVRRRLDALTARYGARFEPAAELGELFAD